MHHGRQLELELREQVVLLLGLHLELLPRELVCGSCCGAAAAAAVAAAQPAEAQAFDATATGGAALLKHEPRALL